ncbi:hypothetical protein Tco_0243256 [Tanacetum coccineum]|uniref:Uncharacterized protein n=1 Tax=Tanacetum coccineum TaxID=301880 RepID=A0ABQ5CF12_9ASTR
MDKNHKAGTSSKDFNQGMRAQLMDADIRPIDNEEPMAEVQTTDDNVSATGQQHTEQPESNNEGEGDQNADQCYDTCPLPAKLTDNTTIELSNQLLESENNFKTSLCLQVDVNNDLSKPVTTHHLPKGREFAPAKPHHMIAPSSSRWFQQKDIQPLAQQRLKVNPPNGPNADIPNQCEANKRLMSVHVLILSTGYIVQSTEEGLRVGCEKKDISENKASRNFDLMITQ